MPQSDNGAEEEDRGLEGAEIINSRLQTASARLASQYRSCHSVEVPTVLREKGYRFFFYMADQYEPPHIHVEKQANAAKFWLDPLELAFNDRFREHELSEIRPIIKARMDELFAAWYKSFGEEFGNE